MISIKLKNIDGLLSNFKKYGDDAVKEFGEITKIRALEIEFEAKRLAPVDDSFLRSSIKSEKQRTPLEYKVTAYMPYAPFQEFGTGGLVNIPSGWAEMAEQFRGKGIRQVNMEAQPFMYPAFVKGSKLYIKDLKNSIKRLNKDFNNG